MGTQIDWDSLIREASRARGKAFAPYSGFRVGAALITDSGHTFCGCNVENASFGLSICAERAAVAAAVLAGFQKFVALAIATDTDAPTPPCGACRQVLTEFNPSLGIRSAGRSGIHGDWPLTFLLPSPFLKIQKA
jgi:cytidine deaminase